MMNKTNLYRIHSDEKILQRIKEINFADAGFKERFDIQEWIASTPEILGEDLLIIAKENSCFDGTKERPDLIALDKNGDVVIIELKRDDSGKNTAGQAINYAAFWSRFTANEIIAAYADHLKKFERASHKMLEENASQQLLEFIEGDSFENLNSKQRIILVSHRFTTEVLSAAHWLRSSHHMDIKCIELIPYYDSDKDSYYLQCSEKLPVIEVDDLIVKPATELSNRTFEKTDPRREREEKKAVPAKVTPQKPRRRSPKRRFNKLNYDEVSIFCQTLHSQLIESLDESLQPIGRSHWANESKDSSGPCRYFHFWYNGQPLWENKKFCYTIRYYPENTQIDNLAVALDISRKHLLSRGVTEVNFDEIVNFLKNVKIDDFRYREEKPYIMLECWTRQENLSEKNPQDILSILRKLVICTQPLTNWLST